MSHVGLTVIRFEAPWKENVNLVEASLSLGRILVVEGSLQVTLPELK